MSRIIYIVNINSPTYSRFCINSWKKWGENNNAQVVELTESFGNIEPHWFKTYSFQLLNNSEIDYDRILVVDNDTIVSPHCPDFFNLVSEDEVGVVHDDVNFDWTIRSTEAYHKHVFSSYDRFDPFEYFNSGFLILSKQHENIYNKIISFLSDNYGNLNWVQSNYGVGRDQTPLNFLLRNHQCKLKFLSKKFNLQGLISKEITDPAMLQDMAYVYHFNAMPRDYRTVLMEKVYRHLYE